MKAAFIERHGGPEVIQVGQRPDPVAGAGEVRVLVKACSLNHLDLWVRMGGKRLFPLPLIPGSDFAGVREDTGQEVVVFPGVWKGDIRPGESVATADEFGILGANFNGGMAEMAVVPTRNCIPKPQALSFVEAAAVPVVFVTAWHMLLSRAQLRSGEWVLVNAAGSGVSHAAIQIAKLFGGKVIATSSSPDKLKHAQQLGADYVLNYKNEDVAARVRQITAGHGVDIAFDHVGAPNWEANMAALAKGGRLVICGVTGGAEVPLNIGPFYFQCQSVLGSTLGTPEELARALELVAHGQLKVVIDRTFKLDQLPDAHRYLEKQQHFGKVVIEIGP
jgi:NADPH:quinone reductase-like Zn-dependent oxidoreductase